MRPHRFPIDGEQREDNRAYLAYQRELPEFAREADAGYSAEWDLRGWADWRREQPDNWFGGWRNLPTIWGGPNENLDGVNDFLLNRDQPQDQLQPVQLGAVPPRFAVRPAPDFITSFKKFKPLNLEKLKPGDPVVRDVTLPPFRVDYDQYEQINTKLNQTVIMIKDNPFFVRGVYDLSENGETKFGLNVQDHNSQQYGVLYKDVADCRPIAPGYVTKDATVYWLFRGPERQNQQGMNHRNTFVKYLGSDGSQGVRYEFLLAALSSRKDMAYDPAIGKLIELNAVAGVRLSNNVAVYKADKKGAPVGVEYCGRKLGLIVEGGVKFFDENDMRPSWIHKDLNAVNLFARA